MIRAMLALLVLFLGGVAYASTSGPVVGTREGPVRGSAGDGIELFRGIPYARPPVGVLRWRPPAPVTPRTEVLDATLPPAVCPQVTSGPILGIPLPAQSEDCLTLSIWRPSGVKQAPVVVWIHGGSLVSGTGDFALTAGTAFAKAGILVVGVNYRLGYLGFFAHPAFGRSDHALANFGLADQQAALRWVRNNIAAFGGDPRKVTLIGESAGARAVLAHMTSRGSDGLFQRAIVQSAFHMRDLPNLDRARTAGAAAAEKFAKPGANLNALQSVPFERIVASQPKHILDEPAFGLAVDRVTLDELPHRRFLGGGEAQVPLMIGYNSEEATLMPSLGLDPSALATRLKNRYPTLTPAGPLEAAGREFFQAAWFAAPARMIARAHSRTAPTYLYRFDYRLQALEAKRIGLGHGEELPLVFGSLDAVPGLAAIASPRDRAVSRIAIACWINFIRSGNPTGGECPDWPSYRAHDDKLLQLGPVSRVVSVPDAAWLDRLERNNVLGDR